MLVRLSLLFIFFISLFQSGWAQAKSDSQDGESSSVMPWRVFGDFRIRLFEEDTNFDKGPSRTRGRYRLRIGAKGGLTEDLDFRIGAASGDPHNALDINADFYNDPHTRSVVHGFNVEQAYLHYHPNSDKSGLNITVGKAPNPLRRSPTYSSRLWDGDIYPAGVWVAWRKPDWHIETGAFVLDRFQTSSRFQGQAFQFGGTLAKPTSHSKLTLDLGFYNLDLPKGSQVAPLLRINRGNATLDTNGDGKPDRFASDFRIINALAKYDFQVDKTPATVSLELFKNLGAAKGRPDEGFVLSAEIGKLKEPGDWSGVYQFANMEQDAVLSSIVGDDLRRGSNYQGHIFGLKNRLTPSTWVGAYYFTTHQIEPTAQQQHRYRVDYNLTF